MAKNACQLWAGTVICKLVRQLFSNLGPTPPTPPPAVVPAIAGPFSSDLKVGVRGYIVLALLALFDGVADWKMTWHLAVQFIVIFKCSSLAARALGALDSR